VLDTDILDESEGLQGDNWLSRGNRFLAIVCTDNPYKEVWQPAEGTCERFAMEGES
jgi:hypothetical protein